MAAKAAAVADQLPVKGPTPKNQGAATKGKDAKKGSPKEAKPAKPVKKTLPKDAKAGKAKQQPAPKEMASIFMGGKGKASQAQSINRNGLQFEMWFAIHTLKATALS